RRLGRHALPRRELRKPVVTPITVRSIASLDATLGARPYCYDTGRRSSSWNDRMTPERFANLQRALERRQPDLTVFMDGVIKGQNLTSIVRTADAVGIQ